MSRRKPAKLRLLRVGLASLMNRKENAAIKYLYRRVGTNPNERYSFRWQPQFFPNNNTSSEYLKKRLFSWSVKRRSDAGTLPEPTTEGNWSKNQRNNPDWRAAHYFWSWRFRGGSLRMDNETKNTDNFIRNIGSFYKKYLDQHRMGYHSERAFKDLIRAISSGMGPGGNSSPLPQFNTKMTIQSSDGATARSNEERLIYLAPHLNKHKFKQDKDGARIAKFIAQQQKVTGRPQQLDVVGGTPEGKIIEDFLKTKEKEIIAESNTFSTKMFTQIKAGADVTEKPLVARWGEELVTLDTKRINKIKSMPKAQKYKEYKEIIKEVKSNLSNLSLSGEAQRRLSGKGEAKGSAYTFFIPTGAGDLLAFKIAGDGSKPIVRGAIVPDVTESLGVAAVTHYLGADLTQRAMTVIDTGGRANTFGVGAAQREYRHNQSAQLLFMRDSTSNSTERPFNPTYHISIMPTKEYTARLADLVEDAFGAYYNNGTWQDFFDPQSQYSNNNAFRMWSTNWIKKSKELTESINKAATDDTDWKQWMQGKVKAKPKPYAWAHPVHIRPFLLTDKTGGKQYLAARQTPQGNFDTRLEGYLDNLSRM